MGFCDSQQSTSNDNKWADPLGPSSMSSSGSPRFSPTGAPQMRSQLYSYLGGYLPQMTGAAQDYAGALSKAAANPGFEQASSLAGQELNGNYLNGSPALNRALALQKAGAMGDAAGETARVKSGFNQNGMAFSSANQQADQSARAATAQRADTSNAQAVLQNYQTERGNQANAGSALQSAVSAPLSYLGGVSSAYTQPLQSAGNILSGLSSGGPIFSAGTSGTYSPSTGSDIMNGLGSL